MDFNAIVRRLGALGRRRKLVLGAVGALTVVIVALAIAFGTFALDWMFHLPLGVRMFLAAAAATGLAFLFLRRFLRPIGERQTIDGLALMVERSDPSIQDRLISALQLKRDLDAGNAVESPDLIRVTVEGAVASLGKRSFAKAVSLAPIAKPAVIAAALTALAVAGWGRFPDLAKLWFNRQILLKDQPWPRETDLEVVIVDRDKFTITEVGDRTVISMPERTPLQVQVIAHGKIPASVDLVTAPPSDPGAEIRFSMGRPALKNYFQHIFPPLSEPIVFYAVGGDDDDERPLFEIRVARAPRIQRFWVDYEYPEYTGLRPRTLPDANIAAPEGTRLTMHFVANMPLDAFDIVFEKAGTQSLQAGPDGTYTTTFVIDKSDFYSYRLTGSNGINSVDAPRHVLTCEPDQVPRIQVELPPSTSMLCTPNAVIPLRGFAIDDYGVTTIAVRSGRASEEGLARETVLAGEDLLAPLPARRVTFYRDLLAADFHQGAVPGAPTGPEGAAAPAAEEDRYRFKLLVADNRSTPGQPEPHRQFGDYEYSIQIVPAADVERDLAQRQARLRERVGEIVLLAEARKADVETLVASLATAPSQSKDDADKLAAIATGQGRVTSELGAASRQFQRVFDGYLYNRLDPSNLTEKLLVVLAGLYRASNDVDPFKLYGEAIAAVRPQANESEAMGRLTLILDLFIRSAAERSPEVSRRLAQANLVAGKDDALSFLRGAAEMQRLLIEDLRALEEKLEAWEDYLDIVQGFKDLIDLQMGIRKKAEQLTK